MQFYVYMLVPNFEYNTRGVNVKKKIIESYLEVADIPVT